ncbi:oligosaccharide flippase family protein [Phormidesmis sp. 146-33]
MKVSNSISKLRSRFQGQSSLKKMAMRGVFWSVSVYGLSTIVRLGSSLIMTRLLFPELFGLMNLVFIFIVGLHLFSDVGSAPIIIRSERGDDPELLNNVWTIQVIRGVLLWLGCLVLAWPATQIYNEPRLIWLLPIVGISCVIGGFHSTSVFTLTRRMESGRWSRFELENQVLSTAILIALAWFNQSIWSLVIGALLSELIQVVRSHFLIPNYRNRLAWDWKLVKEMFSFGQWILLSTMLTFLAGQVDRLLSGRLLSWQFLGVYGVALAISDMPRNIIAVVSDKVIFPAVSQLIELPRETLRAKLLHNRKPVLAVLALGLAILVSFGDVPITIMYDKRYSDATWMLPLLAIGIWPNILFQTLYPILIAIGKPNYQTWGNLFKLIFTGVGILVGFSFLGVAGVIIAVALNDLPLYGVMAFGLQREGLSCLKQDLLMTGLFVGLLIGILALRYGLGFGLPIQGLLTS